MDILRSGGVILACLPIAVFLYRCVGHPLARYPGPLSAATTNLWQLVTFLSGQSHLKIQSLHQKHGSVVRIGPNSLSFSSLAAYQTIYGFGNAFEKGPFYDFGREPGTGEGDIFSARTSAQHRVLRRAVGPAMTSTKARGYESAIEENVNIMVSIIASDLENLAERQMEPILNVAHLMHAFVMDSTFETITGTRLWPAIREDGDALLEDMRSLAKFAFAFAYVPILNMFANSWIGRAFTRRARTDKDGAPRGLTAVSTCSLKAISAHYQDDSRSFPPSILKSFFDLDAEHRMSRDQVTRETFNLIAGGQGSTTACLVAVLYQLGLPEGQIWQRHIREELTGASLGHRTSFPPPSLSAVVTETLRYHPPFASAFPRDVATAESTCKIPGIEVPLPVGTTVSCNPYVLSRSEEIWGEDAGRWKPERWGKTEHDLQASGGERNRTKKDDAVPSLEERFIAFGKGPRSCTGREIALNIVHKAVAAILNEWEVTSPGELDGKCYLEMQYDRCDLEFRKRAA